METYKTLFDCIENRYILWKFLCKREKNGILKNSNKTIKKFSQCNDVIRVQIYNEIKGKVSKK